MEFRKQFVQVVRLVERRKVRDDHVDAPFGARGPSGQKLLIVAALERDASGVNEVPAMLGKEVTHFRIHVICIDREAALCKKPRIYSRSRTEIK